MAADRDDVAAVEAALGSAVSGAGDGGKAGVGEAVRLPSVAGPGGSPRGRGFDLGEADSLPAGSALRQP